MPTPTLDFCWYYLCHLLRLDPRRYDWRRDHGMTTAEVAVVTFLLVGAAIVVVAIIYAAARSNAENIPVPEAPAP